MPRGLRRCQQSVQSHFLTFSCYRRQANCASRDTYDLFVQGWRTFALPSVASQLKHGRWMSLKPRSFT